MDELIEELGELLEKAYIGSQGEIGVYMRNSDEMAQSQHFAIERSPGGDFLLAAQWDLWDGDDQIVRVAIDLDLAIYNLIYQRELLEVVREVLGKTEVPEEKEIVVYEEVPDMSFTDGLYD